MDSRRESVLFLKVTTIPLMISWMYVSSVNHSYNLVTWSDALLSSDSRLRRWEMEVHGSLCLHGEGCENGCQAWSGMTWNKIQKADKELNYCWWRGGVGSGPLCGLPFFGRKEEAVPNFTGAAGDPKRTFGGIKIIIAEYQSVGPKLQFMTNKVLRAPRHHRSILT
jgi:hypothetical protein